MKKNLLVLLSLLVIASMALAGCGGQPSSNLNVDVGPASTEIPWSYKIAGSHNVANDGSFTTIATVWAKPGLDVGDPKLSWSDGFSVDLKWGEESLAFAGHPLSEAVLSVNDVVVSDNTFGYYAVSAGDNAFLALIP